MTSLRPGFVFGSSEEFRPVPLSAKRLRNPQGIEFEPPSPDVTKGPAEHRAPLVLEEDGERAVVGVPVTATLKSANPSRTNVASPASPLGSETILRSVMIYYLSVS